MKHIDVSADAGARAVPTQAEPAGGNWPVFRLYAVLLVAYANGFVLTKGGGRGLWGQPFQDGGLSFLFAISGYLVADSWLRDPRFGRYVLRRVLRIFPGLSACVLVTVFVIGPIATTLTLRSYFLSGDTRAYLRNILLSQHMNLPGVFANQQWVGAVNPMLWTLFAGCIGIVLIPALLAPSPRWRAWPIFASAVAAGSVGIWLAHFHPGRPIGLHQVNLASILSMAPFFLASAAFRSLEAGTGRLYRADIAILCFAANWIAASWLSWWSLPLQWLTIPYMTIAFGRLSAPVLAPLGRAANPAYGAFLYAFPLQQLIVARLPNDPLPVLTCCVLTVLAGLLSWFAVEKPAIAFGRKYLAG